MRNWIADRLDALAACLRRLSMKHKKRAEYWDARIKKIDREHT